MHSYAAIVALLVPGLLASPMPNHDHDHDHHSSGTTDAITSAPTPTASSSSTSHWNSQDSAIRSDVTAIGGILQSLTDHATTTSHSSSSSSTSAASSSSTTASSSTLSAPGYQTSQYTGQGGNGQNFGTDGPGPMFDWLADQCGDGECPGSLQYSGGNWPAPITGQNNGHMDLTIVSSYRNKTVLTDFYLPAFKAFYAANQNSTKQYYDPFPASSHPDSGPLPSMEIISAPGYFGLRRYPANDPTAGPSDWLSITSAYVADDSAAEFLCSTMISLVGMSDPWMGFFGSMLAPVCDEL